MRDTVRILAVLAFAAACHGPDRVPPTTDGQGPILARIDGQIVRRSDYRAWLADLYGPPQREEYLTLWLIEREARRRGIEVSAEEVDHALEELWSTWVRERLGGDAAALDAELARNGHDRESYRRWFRWEKRRELLTTRLVLADRSIDEPALRAHFERRYGPGGVRTRVRVLALSRSRLALELNRLPESRTLTAAELDERLLEKANALRARAAAGEPFEQLVRAESHDLGVRKDGGLCDDAQWRLRGADFVRAVDAAAPGVVSEPVPHAAGVDLFEVVERQTTDFESVREALLQELIVAAPTLEEVTALQSRLRDSASIERY